MAILRDGTGSGYLAKIDNENRLKVSSVTETFRDHGADGGKAYNLNTGVLTLTSAAESAVAYVENQEDNDLVITTIVYNLGNSTGGSGDWLVEVIRNPTAGTVVSDAIDMDMISNQNFGSNRALSGNFYKGGQGKTLTDGDRSISSVLASSGRHSLSLGAVHLPKGTSLGVKITPQTGNTSVDVEVAFSTFIIDPN